MIGRVLAVLAVLVFVAVAGALYWFKEITEPVPHGDTVFFTIPPGSSAVSIADILLEEGMIRHPWGFRIMLRLEGADGLLKAGEYEMARGLTLEEIIKILIKGQTFTVPFTVPEGLTVVQTAQVLGARDLVDPDVFMRLARELPLNADFLPEGESFEEPMEGYLFPETYRVPRDATEEEILALMYQQFKEVFTPELQERAEEIGLTVHEVVTLASIIEREAMVDDERATISGVYHNRLRIGMKLDADPTVLYAHGRVDGLVLYRDLEIDSPYNTYRNPGLPPGPIAAPGEASIRAALYPEDVEYFFFLSRNDGTHVFSRTYAEHLRYKAQYQSGN